MSNHNKNTYPKFPKDFYWGASTSAHQVEGGNENNWSVWERENARELAVTASSKWSELTRRRFPEMFTESNYISGQAAEHYDRYEMDFDLAKEGGHNAHRFSIDWARIEPQEGVFDVDAIEHYRDVVRSLRARGLEPFVTLWHWTHPVWLEDRGGVLADDFSQKFAHYAHTMIDALQEGGGSDVKYVMTLNEPMSVIKNSYMTGVWPGKRHGLFATLRAYKNLSAAHKKAYDVIKSKHSDVQVGFTEILASIVPRNEKSFLDRKIARVIRYFSNEKFIKMTGGKYDFLGVQYYFHISIGVGGIEKNDYELTDLEWSVHAEGLYNVIREYGYYGVPLYVTENGLADRDDRLRSRFLYEHIGQVQRALGEGINVRGYFHWSLLDNFEWDKGYWPRFGLVGVDFGTQERTPRKSFGTYRQIIEEHTRGE